MAVRRIAEISAVVVGWLVSYTYVIHLVGPYADTCTQGDDSSYLASVILSALTVLLSTTLIALGPTRSRWFLVPHVGTLVIAAIILPGYLGRVTIHGRFICAGSGYTGEYLTMPAAAWHRLYAPAHTLLLGGFLCWAWFRQNAADLQANMR